MSRRSLSRGDAAQIKRRVWGGELFNAVAREMSIHPSTISRIASGELYSDIQWPDGSQGPLPLEQRRSSRAARRHKEWAGSPPPSLGPSEGRRPEGEDLLADRVLQILQGEDPDRPPVEDQLQATREAVEGGGNIVRQIADRAEQDANKALMSASTGSGIYLGDEDETPKEIEYELITWDEVKALAPRCKWVVALENEDDGPEKEVMKKAMGIVFMGVPLVPRPGPGGLTSWDDEVVGRLISDTLRQLLESGE